jgi:hypothetical protein
MAAMDFLAVTRKAARVAARVASVRTEPVQERLAVLVYQVQ